MTSANCKPSRHQPTLIELKEKAQPMEQSKFDAITEATAEWIVMNDRPTNIVTDEGLQDVICIASSNRSYELPSRPVIDSRLDDLFNSEKDKIQKDQVNGNSLHGPAEDDVVSAFKRPHLFWNRFPSPPAHYDSIFQSLNQKFTI